MEDFAEQALLNPETVITLAGKGYAFKEPCKRDCSIWLGKGTKIANKIGIVTEDMSNISPGGFFEAIPEVLDFIYDFLKISLKERDRINNEFELEEVTRCFTAIIERVTAPFVTGKTSGEMIPEENPLEPPID